MIKHSKATKAFNNTKSLAVRCVVILMISIGFFTYTASAQVPYKMSYQAIIRNSTNALVTNSAIGMRISILPNTPNGMPVYTETQTTSTNDNGVVSLEIGSGTVLNGNFLTIDWANGPYFIKTETDPTGGINYSITATNQLLSVPYALYALKTGSVTGGSNFSHYIGEQFGGGVVFHLWKDSIGLEHGLIVDLVDIGINIPWSNVSSTLIGPSAQSEWNGLSNSMAIVSQVGHTNSAADICLNSTNGGQNDWYLPSRQEFYLMFTNYTELAKSFSQISGAILYNKNTYWTSTEYILQGAYCFSMPDLLNNIIPKSNTANVRAIREF